MRDSHLRTAALEFHHVTNLYCSFHICCCHSAFCLGGIASTHMKLVERITGVKHISFHTGSPPWRSPSGMARASTGAAHQNMLAAVGPAQVSGSRPSSNKKPPISGRLVMVKLSFSVGISPGCTSAPMAC